MRWALFDRGYAIMNEGEITADVLEQRMAFERQYCGAVARAKAEAPGDLPGRDVIAFRKVFNLHWKTTIERDIIVGAWAAMERLGIGAQELATRWQVRKADAGLALRELCVVPLRRPTDTPARCMHPRRRTMRARWSASGAALPWVSWMPCTL